MTLKCQKKPLYTKWKSFIVTHDGDGGVPITTKSGNQSKNEKYVIMDYSNEEMILNNRLDYTMPLPIVRKQLSDSLLPHAVCGKTDCNR